MRYVVTGGAGFVGSNLVRALLERGADVVVVDNFSTGKRENLEGLDLELVEGGAHDPVAMNRACAGADGVFHLAAYPSVPFSVKNPVASQEFNLMSTAVALTAARDADVKRFVLSSSAAVYGDSGKPVQHEDDEKNPLSPYAVHKFSSEYLLKVFADRFGMATVSLRYFNGYGPHQDPKSDYSAVIPKFITTMLAGKRPTIFGDGSATRDFVYVGDMVQANLRAANGDAQKVAGQVVNVAGGIKITVLELVKVINKVLGTSIEPIHDAPRDGDILHSMADISRAKEIIGYVPQTRFKAGLAQTVEWYRQ